jgi:hypothetical protein
MGFKILEGLGNLGVEEIAPYLSHTTHIWGKVHNMFMNLATYTLFYIRTQIKIVSTKIE